MTLTVATSANIPQHKLEAYITTYTSLWPPSIPAVTTTTSGLSPVPTLTPTDGPPTSPPHHRWRRRSKENAKRRRRIKRGNRRVFWLPNGTFPGGWFYGLPDFSAYENNQTSVESTSFPATKNINKKSDKKDFSTKHLLLSINDDVNDTQMKLKGIEVHIDDSVTRGVGYLAGYAPSPLGRFPFRNQLELENDRLKDPLCGYVALLMLKEVRVTDGSHCCAVYAV
jgi:hypothetical protein